MRRAQGKEKHKMIEQNLAALFRDSAEVIKCHRAELVSRVPEVEELCAGLDELTEFLEEQSHALSAIDRERKGEHTMWD